MKKTFLYLLMGSALTWTGCVTEKPVSHDAVVVTEAPVTTTRVVTVLPSGYTTTTYRGNTYYTYRNTYYRAVPGGYTVVTRPY
jgi:hypothetical protein